MAVPGPTRVRSSFSCCDSTATISSREGGAQCRASGAGEKGKIFGKTGRCRCLARATDGRALRYKSMSQAAHATGRANAEPVAPDQVKEALDEARTLVLGIQVL